MNMSIVISLQIGITVNLMSRVVNSSKGLIIAGSLASILVGHIAVFRCIFLIDFDNPYESVILWLC